MKDTVAERVKAIIEYLGISVTQFAKSIDTVQSVIANMFLRGTEPSSKILRNIANTYDMISVEWLLTGKGDMLKSEVLAPPEGSTPLLPVEAWGGSLNGPSIAILAEQCKKYNVPISNIDYLIPIAGDSMMPDYCPGDVVAIKKINEHAFIEWGKVYVLDTCNGVVIKEVQPSDNDGCVTCISRNMPEKYKPFEISLNPVDFFGMYAVKGTVRIS